MDKKQAIRQLRKKLGSGGATIGGWMQLPSSAVAELMGDAGYDWVTVDLEHGSFSLESLPDIFRALELGHTLPFARVAEGHPRDCKQALDAGAAGIIIPMVESGAQLKAVVDACRWPAAGKRGVGFSRANLFGKRFDDYAAYEAQAPVLVAMIEHIRAVDNLEDILAVEGLDAIFVGPYDLSASMGITGQFEDGKFKDVLARIRTCATAAGVAHGLHVVNASENELRRCLADGHQFVAYSLDSVMLRAVLHKAGSDILEFRAKEAAE